MTDQVSTHFHRGEFACRDGCGFDTIDAQTLQVLEAVRQHFGKPVIVNSACRCPDHNRAIGGAANSQHLYGRACDIRIKGIDPDDVHDWTDANFPFVSLGRYATFTHVDTRSDGPARWRG